MASSPAMVLRAASRSAVSMLAAIALALVLAAAPARAEDRASAERYFRAGAKAYAAQNFSAAVANFDEAYRALPVPEIAFSAAQAYRRLYRVEPRPQYVLRAVELYRIYLDKVKTGGRVGDAADNLGEMERELDRLKLRGAVSDTRAVERTRLGVNVTIRDRDRDAAGDAGALREVGDAPAGGDSAMAGVTTAIDGKPVEPFALIDVSPGEHVVTVTADGYFPVEKKQRAVRGAAALVEIDLVPRPAQVAVATEAGATITVDGRPGSPKLELAAGRHLIAVTRRGREPFATELAVGRGQRLTVDAPLAKTGQRRAVPWLFAGAGALALGAAAATTLAFVHDGRAADQRAAITGGNQLPATGDAYDREVARRDDWRTAAWLLGGGALAAGAVGAMLYYFDTPSSHRVQIAPVAGPRGAGLTVRGRL